MSSKISSTSPDSTGTAVLVQSLPHISLSSQLLSSVILLPPNPVITYSVYTSQDPHAIELARRRVFGLRKSSIVQSLLPSVLKDGSSIYVCAISSSEQTSDSHRELNELILDGLEVAETSTFTPQSLYPCTGSCSSTFAPCATCLIPTISSYPFPRRSIRQVYSQFLQAVRERLIDDVAEASKGSRPVKRYRNGFLLGPSESPGEWSAGWEQYARCRPLVYVHLHLHLSSTRLIVQPLLKPTSFHPILFYLPSPCTLGTPLTLLPYGTPAYFLTTYSGPTSVLTSQFESALTGLGAGEWTNSPPYVASGGPPTKGPAYVIAWVSVQNKQGEEKGIMIVWPARLCLAFHPSMKCPRQPLQYAPELPTELQPSPPPPTPPQTEDLARKNNDSDSRRTSMLIRPSLQRNGAYTSRLADTAKAFRASTIAKSKDVSDIASEVGGYVDTIVKERERERERLRKERENGQMQTSSPAVGAATPRAGGLTIATPSAMVQEETPIFSDSSPLIDASDSPMVVDRELLQPPDTSPMDVSLADTSPPAPTMEAAGEVLPEEMIPTGSVSPTSNTFDSYAWGQSTGDYMSFGGGGTVGELGMNFGVSDGFDVFTDDDFSFFDRPDPAPPPPPTLTIEPIFGAQVGGTSASPWTAMDSLAGTGIPGFGGGADGENIPPELDPSSPAGTPSAYSDPPTPAAAVQLVEGLPSHQVLLGVPGIFEAIPFSPYHRLADEKYAMGKFAVVQSPKDQNGEEMGMVCPFQTRDGWRLRYDAVTDPRIGVVRQLRGVKRKSIEQGMRELKLSPSWIQEPEDWAPCTPADEGEQEEEEADEQESDEDEQWMDEDSRPSTPPPSYLPLGPTLLATHFEHSQLLALSTALRPPGSAVALTPAPPPPLSVPTPVSPAAAIGAASEKSKSLEAAALMFAREIVENPVWARACRLRARDEEMGAGLAMEVWQSDVKLVRELVGRDKACFATMELKELFQDATKGASNSILQSLKPPLLTVSKSDLVIQMRPTALRFWAKLGLSPRSGKKNVTSFVFFEDESDVRVQQVKRWLEKVSLRYNAKNLGSHVAGVSSGCVKDGLVPVKFESIRKTLVNFVSTLDSGVADNIVFYVVTPPSIMALSSPVLRQIFSATKRTGKTHAGKQILFHLVPDHIVFAGIDDSSVSLDPLIISMYDRILTPVDRSTSRPDIEISEPRRSFVQEPAFVLSRPLRNFTHFQHKPQIHILDIVDRHTLLHVGYNISKCGKWLVAACVDQRGEGYDIGVWLVPGEGEGKERDEGIVNLVWGFVGQMARRANVEWRVVVTKLGRMSEGELQTWMSHLRTAATDSPDVPLHATVLSAIHGTSWTFLAPDRKSQPPKPLSPQRNTSKDNHNVFLDISSTTYALYPSDTHALPLFPPLPDFESDLSCIPEPFSERSDDNDCLSALPWLSSSLIHVPAGTDYTSISMLNLHLLYSTTADSEQEKETLRDVTNNFYELAVLAEARGLADVRESEGLPLHLAMLERVVFGEEVVES
ncbi:hypothetical protein NEOLEDRAFT_831679 [Neolentinus lepideus HHB14362 ss-1]|uniref:Mediator of RNA polymerase II transcription subunit 13 n=1 Tax=Neolentinus lepideus HHB14362 ss-1 TaxID=1314782 RepID=A0A165P721_9AGAM|nr:hypothetical protein NEOLEDRAFT_831679 [Neolentinus lepideus HHB14362 ss-1]